MKKFFLTLSLFSTCIGYSQNNMNRCATPALPQQFETWVQNLPPLNQGGGKNGGAQVQSVFNIPVIVHVIHNNEPVNSISATSGGNLNAAQIIDQINILNKDFNGLNSDTSLIPAVFKPVQGKFQFNFCMAAVDPNGNILAEPGIDRINRVTKGWTAPPYSTNYINNTIKPNSIWDPNRYLNMWVCGISGGILGYATFPDPGSSGLPGIPSPYGTATNDGIVVLNTAFGSIGTAAGFAPYNKGRTTTHEIGHWVGLRHIWGDGNCATDYCADTPPAQSSNGGCPTHPHKLGTCAGNTTGEMFMNFMDYTDDACMYMFSKDQKYRGQLIMTNSPMRLALLSSTVCNLPATSNDIGITFVSSPTYSQVINCNNFINPVLRVNNYGNNTLTSATFTFNVDGQNTQTFNWTGSLAPTASVNIALPQISNLTNGAHVFTVGVFSPNGGTDANMSNNGNMQHFSIANSFTLNASASQTSICGGQSATLTASGGAGSYTWNPGNIIGTTAVVSPASSTTYTLAGSSGTCINTRTVSIVVSPSLNISVNSATVCSGNAAVLSASGAASYTWNTGSNSSSISVSPASTTIYTVNGSQSGCTGSKTATVTVNATPTVAVNNATICSGNTATLTASGAATYSWSTGAMGSAITVAPGATTVYTVTGTNGNCSNVRTATVTVNTPPALSVNNATLCSGGSATLSASGAATYLWSTGAVSATIAVSPSVSAVYTVTGTSNGCQASQTSTVTVSTTPTVSVNNATVCSGASATLTASGASSYSWSTGAGSSAITVAPLSTTIYSVTGFNSGCSNLKTSTVTVISNPTVTVNSATVCSGSAATLTAAGANSYSWNTGASTAAITVTPSSTTVYTVTGTSNSCTNVKTATVTVNATPNLAVNNATICSGSSATLTASGATSYSWNTTATTAVINVAPLSTTVYTVTGSNGPCSNIKTATVVVNTNPTVNVNSATICSGTGTVLLAGGAGSYSWSTGATASSISVNPLSTTVYTVTGFSGNCSNMKTATVTVNTTPTVTVNSATICSGGTATLSASGAAAYQWSNGSSANPLLVSPSVTTVYTVTGTSGNCTNSKTATVTVGSSINVIVSPATQTLCAGASATLNASGASNYNWSNGFSGSSLVITPTVSTTYTVTGFNGACSGSTVAAVIVAAQASISVSSASLSCFGDANATATINASGGTAPYTYSFSTGANTQTTGGLSAGVYTAIAATADNCASSVSFTVNGPGALVLNSNVVNSSCGRCNGSISYTASGGTAGYSYTFMPGSSSSSLCAGTYSVFTTDANGCSNTTTLFVGASAGVNLNVSSSVASCNTCSDGSATVTAAGGNWPYVYQWLPSGGTSSVAAGLSPGCYTVTVTDQQSCSSTSVTCVEFTAGLEEGGTNNGAALFPNPTGGPVMIRFRNTADRVISVIDMTGRVIAVEKSPNESVALDLSSYAAGVYYVLINEQNGATRFKVVKQ